MAVCGRCLICGHKFAGYGYTGGASDEAVRWDCSLACNASEAVRVGMIERHEHAICTGCHDLLVGDVMPSAVTDLLALIRERRGR